jgi:hypothetical protein
MMRSRITAQTKRELVIALRARYVASSRIDKARILDEFTAISGYHRKSATRILNGSLDVPEDTHRRSRARLYDAAVRQALIVLWEASDRICSKRLKALLPVLLPALERNGHLQLAPAIRARLTDISATSIDRLLREVHSTSANRRRNRAPTALRRSVPIRTFADWTDAVPGYMEMDLVVHCGESMTGSYAHTLCLTDVASGWTQCVPLLVRESSLVIHAIESLRASLPFLLRGLDVDNGSEFLNDALLRYCAIQGVEFTRSRPYHKNDQAWIEQKNGSVVRRLAGYRRLEGTAAVEALARLYAAARLFVNFFQPSFKLTHKSRSGARIVKRYDNPQTPCARLLASSAISEQVKDRLRDIAKTLDPLQLLDEIRRMQQHLALLANGDKPHTLPKEKDDLARFLASLSSSWHAGEVRATHCQEPKRPRYWRTRKDPFEHVWPTVCGWLESDPDATGKDLFERLQREYPSVFPDAQLRTLQRRLKQWRNRMAHRLAFGVTSTMTDELIAAPLHGPRLAPSEPQLVNRRNTREQNPRISR